MVVPWSLLSKVTAPRGRKLCNLKSAREVYDRFALAPASFCFFSSLKGIVPVETPCHYSFEMFTRCFLSHSWKPFESLRLIGVTVSKIVTNDKTELMGYFWRIASRLFLIWRVPTGSIGQVSAASLTSCTTGHT